MAFTISCVWIGLRYLWCNFVVNMGKTKLYAVILVLIAIVAIMFLFRQKKDIQKIAPAKILIKVTTAPTITPTLIVYPTIIITHEVIPTSATIPTQNQRVSSPSPIPLNTPTSIPDSTAPTIQISGPSEGSTITSGNFCFLIQVFDNSTGLTSRNRLDSGGWSEWGAGSSQYNPCFQNVGAGSHIFNVEAKDPVGNTSSQSRSFTITISGQ